MSDIGLVATVMVSDDTHWKARKAVQQPGMILLEDCTLNVGILGTHQQLSTMLDRMRVALFDVEANTPNAPKEVPYVY